MKKETVCVVGLGYIGLPTAALLADNGYQVFGVDLKAEVVDTINQGRIHIVEPNLEGFVKSAVDNRSLQAFTRPQPADVFIICVPTPFYEGNDIPQPNIEYVLSATRNIASFIKPGNMIILESTSPVGTTQKMADILEAEGVNLEEISVAYCPERVLPGNIIRELIENDRVVGGYNENATDKVAEFYQTFVTGEVLKTDCATAEMCKLVENSYRDVNIAFANELSLLSSNAGINVWRLIELANRHPRVNILQPGTGVGGHCIAVDPWFIVAQDPETAKIIHAARTINNAKTDWVIDQIDQAAADFTARTGKRPKIACMGLAFKPDIDDLRDSPAMRVALSLHGSGEHVIAVEPNISRNDALNLVNIDEVLAEADIVAILVNHSAFADLDWDAGNTARVTLDFCGSLAETRR